MSRTVRIDLTGCRSLCSEARRLIEAGANPDTLAFVYRGETLCFQPMPLRRWARVTVEERADRSARFVRCRPPMAHRVTDKVAGRALAFGADAGEGLGDDRP